MTTKDIKPRDSQIVMLRSADIIDGEAADWLTKLDCGELTKKDRIALKKWLAQDPCHGVALNNMAAMWRDMDFLLNDVSLEEPEPLRIMERLSLARGAAAFAVCLMCTLGLILWSGFTIPTEQAVYTTAIGKQHLQELNDGSSALLNTNSVIETDFTRDSRIVRLMQGEALFDVAHDPSRPFIVYVGDRAVKAIGTTFVVRIESENIHVSVTDGQVQLSKREVVTHDWSPPKSQEVILVSKGEWVETNSTTAIPEAQTIENEEFNRRLSWSQGRLILLRKCPFHSLIYRLCQLRVVGVAVLGDRPEVMSRPLGLGCKQMNGRRRRTFFLRTADPGHARIQLQNRRRIPAHVTAKIAALRTGLAPLHAIERRHRRILD
jgi:transmembrane sensor